MRIAFIGYGNVGGALADHLQRLGHQVVLAARDAGSASVKELLALSLALAVSGPAEAIRQADIVFLATPFQANEAALTPLTSELAGKILVDCTNPVGLGSHTASATRNRAPR